MVHNLLILFFTLGSSKDKVSETEFFDIVTTHNNLPNHVRHLLGSIYVFFTLFGYWVREKGEVSQGTRTQPAYEVFHPWHLNNQSFRNLFLKLIFLIPGPFTMTIRAMKCMF